MNHLGMNESFIPDECLTLSLRIVHITDGFIDGNFHKAARSGKMSLDTYATSMLINMSIADALVTRWNDLISDEVAGIAGYHQNAISALIKNIDNARCALELINTSKKKSDLFDVRNIFRELELIKRNSEVTLYFTYFYERLINFIHELTGGIRVRSSLLPMQRSFYDDWQRLPEVSGSLVKNVAAADMDTCDEFFKKLIVVMDSIVLPIEVDDSDLYLPRQVFQKNEDIKIPEDLKTIPGIVRDLQLEETAHAEKPIYDWDMTHKDSVKWYHEKSAIVFKPLEPKFNAISLGAFKVRWQKGEHSTITEGNQLRQLLETAAAEIGISMLGIAKLDEKYNCQQHKDLAVGDCVIVCVLEQSYEAVHEIPCWSSERAAQECTLALQQKNIELCKFIRTLGFDAMANPRWLSIPYAVDAGLGQLGLNGQLLTPRFGSRCRIEIISTNMPLDIDSPKDFGVEKICDACQVCARRCPPGAIPIKKKYYRGVFKAKLNTARCFPTVAQAEGCAICLKVCPIQRFGLKAVIDEWEKNKRILGKGTDELEAYTFVDGHYYRKNERPKVSTEFIAPEGLMFDPLKWRPD